MNNRTNQMQYRLNDVYRHWKNPKVSPSSLLVSLRGPDLVWVPQVYELSNPRVAIVGQQQKDCDYSYGEFLRQWGVEQAVREYESFNFAENYEGNNSPFWQFFNIVRSHFHGEMGPRGTIAWVNLVKFVMPDQNSILGQAVEQEALAFQDGIFQAEIEILKPDICIFVTGPDYDFILERYFCGLRFDPLDFPVRQFARLVHPKLPKHSYRTYHPNYLNRDRKGRWNKVLHILSRELKWPNTVPWGNAPQLNHT